MITIVNYGNCNLGSIKNSLSFLNIPFNIGTSVSEIDKCKKLIFPGVGAFDKTILNLKNLGLIEILEEKILRHNIPVLGICLGMQIMTRLSGEGKLKGLGYVPGYTELLDLSENFKVPHIGWNSVKISSNSNLLKNINRNSRFYFLHSYQVNLDDKKYCLLESHYEKSFVSAYQYKNIYGVQFHPEKSYQDGFCILKNFYDYCL